MNEPLLDVEHEAMRVTGELCRLMTIICGTGEGSKADYKEFVSYIHPIQNMILAQAAGRLYKQYRVME